MAAVAASVLMATCDLGLEGVAEARSEGNSADRLIFWDGCENVVSLSDAELDDWKARGVDGFVCMAGRLYGLGGEHAFTGDPDASLDGDSYQLQRQLRDSRIVERAAAREIKLYLGVKLANYYSASTPLKDWFDDSGWSEQVLPRMRDLAGAARLYGFAGLAFDQELYPQRGGTETATWHWNYPGNIHAPRDVRAKATQRGEELMAAILGAFPGVELAVYDAYFPGDWREQVQELLYGRKRTSSARLDVDFWDGMTSVEGYAAIRFYESIFYKAPHWGTWDTALTFNQNRVFATFSRRFSNWEYASSRVHVSPFSWMDPGPNADSGFDDARPPGYVAEQLRAFRKWGMGGEFANYVYGGLNPDNYAGYTTAMQTASSPGPVDDIDPTLRARSPTKARARSFKVAGTAHDNLAIRAVRWRDDAGGSGVAKLTWRALSGGPSVAYEWEMRWLFPAREVSPAAERLTIIAEDIKGNKSAPALLSWKRAWSEGAAR